jgi:hypothetical protein
MLKERSLLNALGYAVNIALIASVLLIVFGSLWEYSSRRYLKGFADAVVPYSGSPEQKVQAILDWMGRGPARHGTPTSAELTSRDPEDTLNYGILLRVCGSATNAFVNLADASFLESRRLLLIDPSGNTNHVVAEVLLEGRWVVVDPSFHTILKDKSGRLLTRENLADPGVFQEATQNIPNYDSNYVYARTTHLRLRRIPLIGGLLQRALDFAFPKWEESFDWTLLAERESFAVLVTGIVLLLLGLLSGQLLDLYESKRFGTVSPRLWEQLKRASAILLDYPETRK